GAKAVAAARHLLGDTNLQVERRPRVCVILTCHDHAQHIACALSSVAAQTYYDFECVVLDDGSTDNSRQVIEKWMDEHRDPRFRLIKSEAHRGQMANFAGGLAASEGDIVAFLNADDVWFPGFLLQHVQAHMSRARAA